MMTDGKTKTGLFAGEGGSSGGPKKRIKPQKEERGTERKENMERGREDRNVISINQAAKIKKK